MANNSVGSVSMDLVVGNGRSFDSEIKAHAKGAENAFSSSMKKIAGIVGGAFAIGKIISFGKESVSTATQIQSAFTGLKTIAEGTSKSFGSAQNFITEYTKDGLVSVTEAATAYKNLLSRGYDTKQIEKTMTALKNSAAFGRQANYDLGEAVVTATEGLKNENSILVDNAGVTKNVAKMWEEWARAHNTTTSAMTQAQKIQAEYTGILKETKFQSRDAATYTETFGGKIQQLKMNFTNLKVAIGSVIAPIAQLFIPVLNSALSAVTGFINGIGQLLKALGLSFPTVVSKSAGGIGAIGQSADDTSKDISGTGKAAKKAAKEINKAFAGVDEIQVLNTKQDSPSGGSSGGASGGGSTGGNEIEVVTNAADEANNIFSGLMEKVTKIKDLFVTGFDIGFSNVNFDGILNGLSNIKTNLVEIFTSDEVTSAASNWGKTVIFNLGKITGSIGKIGTNIITSFVGSIDKAISQNKSRISDFFANMFKIDTKTWNLTGMFAEALGSISEVFTSDTATQIGADIISMFSNPLMSVTETLSNFVLDLQSIFVTPIVDNVNLIKTTLENMGTAAQIVTGTLSEAFTHMGDSITQVYSEHFKPFFDSLKTGLSDTFSKFLKVYNEYIQPFVKNAADRFKELWDNHLKPLWDNVSELIGAIMDLLKVLWEKVLKPLIDWFIQNMLPKLAKFYDKVSRAANLLFGTLIDIVNGFIRKLKGFIEFITGVFTGDWDKAWKGIKDIFGGIWDSLKALVKLPINWIIDKLNDFFDSLNKIEIPDWVPVVGGKGFHIKHINRLANGGYVEKNNPQLAIIGDNTKEGEVVSPESKIYEQAKKAIQDSGGGKQEIEIHLYHHYEDGRIMIQKINQEQIDAGEILLLT